MIRKNLSKNVLLAMNLLELRDLAREMGVHSPTILKKRNWSNRLLR